MVCEKERIGDGDGGGDKFGIISYNHLSNKQFQIRLNTLFFCAHFDVFFFFLFFFTCEFLPFIFIYTFI